jgi:ATP/maltotriose-dependent transcriptional regulator MalT
VLTALLNDLGAVGADIVLVLDDYHVIDARSVQEGMAFLLDHLVPQLHVVIASRADPALPLARFIAGFAGDDRYVVDYLVEEVLQRQPDHVQAFLLQTSILGRLSGPLCDAVTGRRGGQALLEALDRGNLYWTKLETFPRSASRRLTA